MPTNGLSPIANHDFLVAPPIPHPIPTPHPDTPRTHPEPPALPPGSSKHATEGLKNERSQRMHTLRSILLPANEHDSAPSMARSRITSCCIACTYAPLCHSVLITQPVPAAAPSRATNKHRHQASKPSDMPPCPPTSRSDPGRDSGPPPPQPLLNPEQRIANLQQHPLRV